MYVALLLGPEEAATRLAILLPGLWIGRGLLLVHAALVALGPSLAPHGRDSLLPARQPAPVTRTEWSILAALLLLASALRFYGLNRGLWYDEIQTLVDYARLPLGRVVTTFDSQNQHLLYSLLSGISIRTFGESAWALRLPAALFGVLSLWAVFQLGRLVSSSREALLAAALLALSYHHIWFSQNARGYTSLLFWSTLGTAVFLQILRGQGRGWLGPIAYGACMAFAVYTHVTAAAVVAAHALVLGFLWWRARDRTPHAAPAVWAIILSGTLALQLYAPVLPELAGTLLTPTMHGVDTVWKDPAWLVLETLRGLGSGMPGGWATLAAALLVGGAGLASYWRQRPAVLALFLLPGLVTAGVVIGLGHNLWPRFFFFSAGFAALAAVRGLFALARLAGLRRPAPVATAAALVLILGGVAMVPRAWRPKQDFLGAARYVQNAKQPADAVVVVDLTTFPYRQWLHQRWDPVDSLSQLEEIERRHPRTWVLYTFPVRLAAVFPDIWERLQTSYRTAAVFPGTVGGGNIVVKVSGDGGAGPSPKRTANGPREAAPGS